MSYRGIRRSREGADDAAGDGKTSVSIHEQESGDTETRDSSPETPETTIARPTTALQRSARGAATATGGTVEHDPGPDPAALSARYGIAVGRREAGTLQRLEADFGSERVSQWADEGMTVETMGKPQDMQAFRQRQQARPEAVPTDIERQNQASLQRSTDTTPEDTPAGDTDVPDSVRNVLSSPGQSLDGTIQRTMEDRMGDSFGDVQVHTGPQAAAACEDINARAFTVGNHVAFNRGEYDPDSPDGQHVIAHELAHVRQQNADISLLPQEGLALEIDPDPKLEQEAEETAQQVVSDEEIGDQRLKNTERHVQQLPDNEKKTEQSGYVLQRTAESPTVDVSSDLSSADEQLIEKFLRLGELSDKEAENVADIFGIEKMNEIRNAEGRIRWVQENHEKLTRILSAHDANNEDRYPDWYEDPHKEGSLVVEFISSNEERELLRAHGDDNQPGYWFIPPKDIGGINKEDVDELASEEIADRLALKDTPKYISKAIIPPETAMRISSIEPNFEKEGDDAENSWPQVELNKSIDVENEIEYEIIWSADS